MRNRIFVLSPANLSGPRARMLLNPEAKFDVARRLRTGDATIGEVFSFVSGLYFRGKLAYTRRFARPPQGIPYAVVVAAGKGLVLPEIPLTIESLREIAAVPIDLTVDLYRETLERDARALAAGAGPDCDAVLLGSIATDKYITPLAQAFAGRLLFPSEFTGRGDMSRGGLMLRSAASGEELTYVPAVGAARRGSRPPKLSRLS